jgi:hypothetical protein
VDDLRAAHFVSNCDADGVPDLFDTWWPLGWLEGFEGAVQVVKHFEKELQSRGLQRFIDLGLRAKKFDVFAGCAAMRQIWMLHFVRQAAVQQGDLVNGSQPGAGNAWHTA